jgi:hypothetical protein
MTDSEIVFYIVTPASITVVLIERHARRRRDR